MLVWIRELLHCYPGVCSRLITTRRVNVGHSLYPAWSACKRGERSDYTTAAAAQVENISSHHHLTPPAAATQIDENTRRRYIVIITTRVGRLITWRAWPLHRLVLQSATIPTDLFHLESLARQCRLLFHRRCSPVRSHGARLSAALYICFCRLLSTTTTTAASLASCVSWFRLRVVDKQYAVSTYLNMQLMCVHGACRRRLRRMLLQCEVETSENNFCF